MTGGPVSLLDNIRISNGPESLRNYFNDLYHTERRRLLELLNDRHLRFYSLYLLKSGIYACHLQDDLNPLYKGALMLSDELSGTISDNPQRAGRTVSSGADRVGLPATGRIGSPIVGKAGLPGTDRISAHGGMTAQKRAGIRKMLRSDSGILPASLKWIVETGWDPDISEGGYELLMERCTAMLLGEFRDRSVLPALADIIFDRHRNGLLIHNLVWAFFKARDPESLYLLAQKLNSENISDISLAKKLLRFIPGLDGSDNTSGSNSIYSVNNASGYDNISGSNNTYDANNTTGSALYFRAVKWLSENLPYICFTDESMQMCSRPIFCTVSFGRGSA
jgi:hypothetical protein